MKIFCRSLVILLCMFVTAGCADLLDPNVDERETSVGANYSTLYDLLEQQGDCTLFLEAVDLMPEYQKKLQGASLVTVFAPSDDMLGPYIAGQYGAMSIAEVEEKGYLDDLTTLIGYHMVQYSYRPIDLLAFSVSGNAVVPQEGDGSCYKYLTYARDAVDRVTDRLGYSYDVFSRERYLPIMSSRLWETRGFTEAEAKYNYEMLFPAVWWNGMDDQLYVGSACVTEQGIPALNGYLYLIDNVAGALDNIYNEIHKDWAAEYTLFAALCDRVDYFEYSSEYTDTYATFGDSIFFHYSWMAPKNGVSNDELPEYGSDWSYHYSDVFDRKLRYTVHCLVPTDRYLEPYITSQFSGYYANTGSEGDAEFIISQLPRNVVFHLLRAFSFDKQDIIFPSELSSTSKPITGYNGEVITINQSDIQDVKMCTNGIIYGLDTLIVSNVFRSVIGELMSNPDYSYYANALTATEIYEQASNEANEYTIFARSNSVLIESDNREVYTGDELDFGTFSFFLGSLDESTSSISALINNNMVYGEVVGIDPRYDNGANVDLTVNEDVDLTRRRYYRTVGQTSSGLYLSTYGGSVFDEVGDSLIIYETYDSDFNGVAYEVDRQFVKAVNTGSYMIRANGDLSMFLEMLNKVGLSTMSFMSNTMMFIPPDTCLMAAVDDGCVPNVYFEVSSATGQLDSLVYDIESPSAEEELVSYLMYYFVSSSLNNLSSYVLPGLGGGGVTSDKDFSLRLLTHVPYITSNDMEYVNISWALSNPNVLTLTDNGGNTINTLEDYPVEFGSNAVMYIIDGCFDYREMYQYK